LFQFCHADRRVSFVDQLIFLNENGRIERKGSPSDLDLALVHHALLPKPNPKPNPDPQEDTGLVVQASLGVVSPNAALLQRSGLDPDDPARRRGSWGMYALYAGAAGRSTIAVFVLAMAVYAFSSAFPSKCSPRRKWNARCIRRV
jgi:hypothetical protein